MHFQFITDTGEHIALFGLLNGVEVTTMRTAMLNGSAQPFPDEKVKSDLTEVAKLLYEQMKLNPDYRLRIRAGETPVAWFLCSVHRIMAPRSSSFAQYPEDDPNNFPLEQWAAMPPWFRDIKPDDPEQWDECHFPELYGHETLPLAYWEGLFYALIAEIQYLYQDLQVRFGERFDLGDNILHNYGYNAHTPDVPFSGMEFAHLLEVCWERVTRTNLTATLDYAIMQRASFNANGETPTFFSLMNFPGLCDVSSMEPVEIIRWLADKQATEVKVAVRKNEQDVPGFLQAREAVRMRRDEVESQRQQTENALVGAPSEPQEDSTRTNTPVQQKRLLPFFSSPADTNSQHSGTERQPLQRGRVTHKRSNLAYVGEKNFAPTNLYRDHSGQRYPQEAINAQHEGSTSSPPTLEPLYHAYSTPPVSRKPLPVITANEEDPFQKETATSGRAAKASFNTKPSTHAHTSPETQPTSFVHESFNSFAQNQSFNLSEQNTTQSFPAFDDTRSLPSAPQDERRLGDEHVQDEHFPILKTRTRIDRARPSTSPTPPASDRPFALRSNTLPTGSSPFGQHDQVEPVPRLKKDQQRYVSAGGHTPLHQRDVMPGFTLPIDDQEKPDTFSMNKDEFLAQIESRYQMEDMARVGGAKKASTTGSEKREKSFLERVRGFSRKSSKAAENDQGT